MSTITRAKHDFEKNLNSVEESFKKLNKKATEEDHAIYNFVKNDKSINQDIYMELARVYFSNRVTAEESKEKASSYQIRLMDFMKK